MEILIILLKIIGIFIYLISPYILLAIIKYKIKQYNIKKYNLKANGQFGHKIKINLPYGDGYYYINSL